MSVNQEKARELAESVIDSMDFDGVWEYAVQQLTEYYLTNTDEDFKIEYDEHFDIVEN